MKARNGKPCVPYVGLFMTDITFIRDGNASNINDLPNWQKFILYYDVIELYFCLSSRAYEFEQNPLLLNLLSHMQHYVQSDSESYNRSLELEPKGATSVK